MEGLQELLIILLDCSSSMYAITKRQKVNKYLKVQDAIQKLLERIKDSNKSNHILISIIPFADFAFSISPSSEDYSYAQAWLKDNYLASKLHKVNTANTEERLKLGTRSSFVRSFDEATKVALKFCKDERIPNNFRYALSIMFFSDGHNYPKDENFIQKIQNSISAMRNSFDKSCNRDNILSNFSLSAIAIGQEVDRDFLYSLATPYTIKQEEHLQTLQTTNTEAAMCVDKKRCLLHLSAKGDSIAPHEALILRKFLFLVTETQR